MVRQWGGWVRDVTLPKTKPRRSQSNIRKDFVSPEESSGCNLNIVIYTSRGVQILVMATVALADSAALSSVLLASATTSSNPIPLTTIFTPPPSCLGVVTYDGTSFWQNGISQTGDPNCYPASFYYIFNSYYTPGICPHHWTSVGQLPHSSGFDAACCPSYVIYRPI